MSKDGSVSFFWGDAEYRFRIAIGEARELEEKRNSGLGEILARIGASTWRVDDIRETLRIGLIGGGMKPPEAHRLVSRYVDGFPFGDNVFPAQAVLTAAIVGDPDDPVGNEEAERAETETPTTEAGV